MTLTETARAYGRHLLAVQISAQDGSLHAERSAGRLTVQPECAAAWNDGYACMHMTDRRRNEAGER